MYLKSMIVAGSVLFAASAFAQGATKYAPGQQPNTNKGPGHSESAPGQQTNNPAYPGHSESAPGQMKKKPTTTGSGTTKSDRRS